MPKTTSLKFVSALLENERVEMWWVDKEIHQAALDLLQSRLDKEWSLCDAVSFIIMQRFHVTDALTTDHHFEQAGFVRLLQP